MAKKYIISPALQKLFVTLGLGAYLTSVATMLYIMAQVYPEGVRFSPFLLVVVETVLLAVILFAIAYFLSSAAAPRLWRFFQSSLFTVMALLLLTIIRQLPTLLPGSFMVTYDSFLQAMFAQVAPALLVLAMYIAALVRYRKFVPEKNCLSPNIQKLFIFLTAGTLTVFTVITLSRIIQQYPTNQNLSSFLVTSIEFILLPIALFLVAYFVSSRRISATLQIFEGVLLATMGMLFFAIVSPLGMYLVKPDDGYWQSVAGNLVVVALSLAAYIAAIMHHRRVSARGKGKTA